MRPLLWLTCLALTILRLDPAQAQEQSKTDRIERQDPDTETPAEQDAAQIMDRTLPFRDGQTLRYYSPDGVLEGWARRRQLTIDFYDADGTLIGRAQRVSQAATRYFAADGTYLGRRINQRLVSTPAVTDYNRFLVPADPQPDGGDQ